MPHDSTIRRSDDVIAAGTADETILLNPNDWTYAHFNDTAARIWDAISEPRTVSGIVEELIRDYAVERSTCEREVLAFVDDMSRRGFLVIESAA